MTVQFGFKRVTACMFACASLIGSGQAIGADLSSVPAKMPAAAINIGVAFDPLDSNANSQAKADTLAAPLSKAINAPVKVVGSRSLREIARGTRAEEYDALWVPSNLAVGAAKDPAYEIYGFDGRMTKMALLVGPGINQYSDLMKKSLYLPQEDSIASNVGTALLSDHGVRLIDFRAVFTAGDYKVAAFAIEQKITNATVAPEPIARAWLDAHKGGGAILDMSDPVPGQTLVVRKSLNPALKEQLAVWFATTQLSAANLTKPTPAAYKYVTGLSHYTPDDWPGLRKVTAAEVVELHKAGVAVIDVRTPAEYSAKHIESAQLVPYDEQSPRIAGGDFSRDGFDISKLSELKKIVVYCNGPECWKSFKAALRANASKSFEAIYWFRGGLPEWERSGLPISRAVAQVAK